MPKLAYRTTMPRPDDPDIIERFTNAIRKGHPVETAATLAGLGDGTAYAWLEQGRADMQAGEDSPHVGFVRALKEAEAAFVEENLGFVADARAPDAKGWVPAMTLMERRMPQHFGRREYREVEQRNLSITVQLPPGAVPFLQEAMRHPELAPPAEDADVVERAD